MPLRFRNVVQTKVCAHEGCDKPALDYYHNKDGSLWGDYCIWHWSEQVYRTCKCGYVEYDIPRDSDEGHASICMEKTWTMH